jgi:hypothetical protein
MAKTQKTEMGRLALREEGSWWNAYYSPVGTMDGAVPLGSLRMNLACNRDLRQRFMDLMREAVGAIITETTGIQPTWSDPETAPEHERAGKA